MELRFYGANCLVFITRQTRVVVDDNLNELGSKTVLKADDIAVYTNQHSLPLKPVKLVIDGPGEYEVSGVSIPSPCVATIHRLCGQGNRSRRVSSSGRVIQPDLSLDLPDQPCKGNLDGWAARSWCMWDVGRMPVANLSTP